MKSKHTKRPIIKTKIRKWYSPLIFGLLMIMARVDYLMVEALRCALGGFFS